VNKRYFWHNKIENVKPLCIFISYAIDEKNWQH
jgi:hypothetical protein